jgi:DnaK suppressor protein
MDDSQLASFREQLLRLQNEATELEKTGDAAAEIVELDQSRVGRLSRMDALQAQAMSQASGRRRKEMYGRINAALLRIDAGDFGDCRSCEEPINPRRLEFDPTAVLCVDCAEKASH